MQHPFAALAGEYSSLLASMRITRADEVRQVAERLVESKDRWTTIHIKTGVPIAWSLASFEREASSNYRLSPAQGDPWDRPSVNVPKGRGPFPNFAAAAEDAYHLDGLDAVGAPNWTWARACYEAELFNGFGYRAHGVHSPYLWAGTNIYDKGKYTSDGVWSAGVRDQQLGVVPLIVTMIALDPSLALVDAMPAAVVVATTPPPASAPPGLDGGEQGVEWLQQALNKLQGAGLVVDGSYGRRTKAAVIAFQGAHGLEADGLAGPLTVAAIEKGLAA